MKDSGAHVNTEGSPWSPATFNRGRSSNPETHRKYSRNGNNKRKKIDLKIAWVVYAHLLL